METVRCDYSIVTNCWVAIASRKSTRGTHYGYGFSSVDPSTAKARALKDLRNGGEVVR